MIHPNSSAGNRVKLLCCAFVAALTLSAPGEIVHRWSFNNAPGGAPTGSVVADEVGSATASVVGNGATFTGMSLLLPGTTTGNQAPANISAYVDLPNGLISSKTDVTVEIWATPVSLQSWQRVFDFGRMGTLSNSTRGGGGPGEIWPNATTAPSNATSSDDFALAIHRNATANTQRIMARLDTATELGANTGAAMAVGAQHHIVCVFKDGAGASGSSGGQITWYLNGALISTLDVNFRLSSIEDRNNWLGRSMYSADRNANIAYNEVRIYNHALTSEEVVVNFETGPETIPLPVPDHVWTFTTQAKSEAPPGETFSDSIAGKIISLRGNGGSLTGGGVVLPGNTNGDQTVSTISAYLDLPNGIVTQSASVTFEAWAAPLSSKNWQRLFDFGRCVSTHGTGAAPGEILDTTVAPGATAGYDNISLTFNNGGNMNSQQLEGQYRGAAPQYSFSTAATTAGLQYHYALVVEDGVGIHGANGCQARWYRNGGLQNSMDFAFRLTTLQDVNNWIGRSMYSGDSNSHLSLDELRIYRRAITQEEIAASYAAGPDPAVGPPEPPIPAPVASRRWDFDRPAGSAPSGTEFPDSAIGEVVTVRGSGATLNGTHVVLPVNPTNGNQTDSNLSAYLDLPDGIISSRPSLTLEAWLTPLSSANWQRIFDFGNSSITFGNEAAPGEIIDGATAPGPFVANDNLFLSLNNEGVLGSHRVEAKLRGGATFTSNTDFSTVTSIGTQYQFVMTVADGAGASGPTGCLVKWYRNGTLGGSIDLPYRLPDLADVNNWIGRSMWSADTNSHFRLNELRLYDRAISTREVAISFSGGPDAVFAPPVAVNDTVTIHSNQKVLVDVLANDGGALAETLEVLAPPSSGTASVKGGKILFTHAGGSEPLTFTYRVGNISGMQAVGTVSVQVSSELRIDNPAVGMPSEPPSNSWQLVEALPGLVFNQPISISAIPGDSKRLFVCERMAKVKHVPDVTATTPVQNVFLDLQTTIAGRTPVETIEGGGNAEHGLLGLAFHPNFASNGYFYVAYTVRINSGAFYQRISRFTVSASDPHTADPASERLLLQQLDEGANHNGGDLHFGPDGYLYYVAGDEENPNDFRLNSQKINRDFFAGLFRIDVDKKPGNLEPNPHTAIPTDDGIARFSVPVDNPFVHTSLGGQWDGTYNGSAITPLSNVRTEFWATGLRHTWRFSFDSATGDVWGGDVGQDRYEEVNKIVKGGNYGWIWREGAHDINVTNTGWPAKPSPFISIDPVYEYIHTGIAGGDAQFKGNSVVGGYVYRGSRYPDLVGSYVFSDSVSGHIWQMNTATGATTRLTGMPGAYGVISVQGVDPFNKDLLFAGYLSGKIMRLTNGSSSDDRFPTTLSATGLFADLADLSPSPGVISYQPNLTFWSDHALKRRWFAMPDSVSRMTWKPEGEWTYPSGMIWVKHFDMELSRGNPATRKRIETRILVKNDGGIYGVSYRWNEQGTEAALVEDAGVEFDLAIDDYGKPHTQRWQIPGRSSCLTCHGDRPLSFDTRQLNRQASIHGHVGNQIDLLASGNFLANIPPPAALLPRHVRPDETAYPLEQRVRSYLAVNCAYCHEQGGTVAGFWDGRPEIRLEQTGLVNGNAVNAGFSPLNRYIVPGDTTHSIVLNRIAATNGFTRMPPLATSELDHAGIQLLTEWIQRSLPDRPVYQTWRDRYFSVEDPAGEKSADPDGDGVDNGQEYLLGSDPRTGAGGWQATVQNGSLRFNRKAHRYYSIETSDTLESWVRWPVPELETQYRSSDEAVEIPLPPAPDGRQFFRFSISEP